MPAAARRCAIYTRKSSEEGLEQDFNSLAAQREACEAFITSQAHEGWRIIDERFDDGGWSGGTLERPALRALIDRIRANRIDVVVIYKIDRLSRSLMDFARLSALFDEHDVSFVSITQHFNTTTSMGRLMLNVLLSFAQFEREITGERIRDKIAASKKKGMWMGGIVPLGYDAVDRQLVINEPEANLVRTIFGLYLEHGSARAVHQIAAQRNYRTKVRQTESGKMPGGRPFSLGHIYKVLRNPVYAGKIAHAGELYAGIHPAIMDSETWERVQDALAAKAHRTKSRQQAAIPGLLVGLLYNVDGQRLTHSHSTSKSRRYRYYIDQCEPRKAGGGTAGAYRIPAKQIERPVQQALTRLLTSPANLVGVLGYDERSVPDSTQRFAAAEKLAGSLEKASPRIWIRYLQTLVRRVIIDPQMIILQLKRAALREALGYVDSATTDCDSYEYRIPAKIIGKRGQQKLVILPDGISEPAVDEKLIRSIARAHTWFDWLKTGQRKSIKEIAAQEGLSESYVMRYIRLAILAPDIVDAILAGLQPAGISVRRLTNGKQLPISWSEQRKSIGLPGA